MVTPAIVERRSVNPGIGIQLLVGHSTARQPIDIDIVAADRFSKTMIVGECKWRNEFDESEALSKLKDRAHCIKDFTPVQYWLFSKNPLSSKTLEKMKSAGNERSVTMEELYQDR